jgi:hypothetical protein
MSGGITEVQDYRDIFLKINFFFGGAILFRKRYQDQLDQKIH